MIKNYEKALEHMFQIDMLNEKRLRDYIKILKAKVIELEIKSIRSCGKGGKQIE